MGRIAGFAAKQALQGKEVKIVNCNDVLITGNRDNILDKYRKMRSRGGSAMKGPNFPRSPEMIMKRAVRGMLPWRQGRGSDALKRVKIYNETPGELEKAEKITMVRELKVKAIKLSKISKDL